MEQKKRFFFISLQTSKAAGVLCLEKCTNALSNGRNLINRSCHQEILIENGVAWAVTPFLKKASHSVLSILKIDPQGRGCLCFLCHSSVKTHS